MAVRQMLLQLQRHGYEVQILGATNFDHPRGAGVLQGHGEALKKAVGRFVTLTDESLQHVLLVTASSQRRAMQSGEESIWFMRYRQLLETFKPDLVFTYGGKTLDLLLASEAKQLGIPVAFYLANGNYTQQRFARDLALVLTNSQAAARMYRQRLGIEAVPLGLFVDPAKVVAAESTRQHLLFVNPSLAKGAALVIRLALLLERRRPDIIFEVVESRGAWHETLRQVTEKLGEPRDQLTNVVVTPNTADMRPVYGRARLLLAPSLWWESAGRVVAEALLNGVPVVVTARGGLPEMAGQGGLALQLPKECYRPPYLPELSAVALQPVVDHIEKLFDDASCYEHWCQRARQAASQHDLQCSTDRLVQALRPFLPLR
ncbi:glycosyltransferase [Desulfuromonas thiophila]|uniref:Glycosyl transferases group 1 n=2 Tax=Desulfuromonas thiophila TaxID=57664 RepID=A0A1G7EXP7_9BACT|nr:glycosyltransferase [Desulfuromonas thiophila]SDE68236.1 Glycosyl transferases group 1 [Desulfuromonas thiophila]